MEKYKLTRSGGPPLAFEGEQIAEVVGQWQNGKEHKRWHDLTVYRTNAGNYVLEIAYHTQWQGESEHYHVEILGQEVSGLGAELQKYDPMAQVAGYPNRHISAELRSRYKDRVSDLLAQIEGAEEVVE